MPRPRQLEAAAALAASQRERRDGAPRQDRHRAVVHGRVVGVRRDFPFPVRLARLRVEAGQRLARDRQHARSACEQGPGVKSALPEDAAICRVQSGQGSGGERDHDHAGQGKHVVRRAPGQFGAELERARVADPREPFARQVTQHACGERP